MPDDGTSSASDDHLEPVWSQTLRGPLRGLPTPDTTCNVEDTIVVLVRALQRWSKDPKMSMKTREKAVRTLYSVWHPDKNPVTWEMCTTVFQALQSEVRRLCELRQRLRRRAADVMGERQDKREQKAMLKRQCPDDSELVRENDVERPWPRSHFAMQVCDGHLHLYGGEWFDGKTYHTYGELFTFSDAWTLLYNFVPGALGPCPRSGHMMCSVGNALYVFGGEFTSKDQRRFKQYADMWKYADNRWECLDSTDGPSARSGHRACAVGDLIFVFGGFTERVGFPLRYHNDLLIFDTAVAKWRKDRRKGRRPEPRSAALMWGGSNCVYLYGGSRPSKKQSLHIFDDLWRFTDEGWEGPFVTGGPKRHGMCVTELSRDKAIFFGGVEDKEDGSSTYYGDMFLLQIPSNSLDDVSWSRIDVRLGPCGRFASQCAVLQGALWIFGGSCECEDEERTLDDVWRFDFESRKWQNVVPLSDRSGEWHAEPEVPEPSTIHTTIPEPSTCCATVSLVCDIDPASLSKKEKSKWEKRQRMEVKKVKMDEKEQKKLEKKQLKQESQKNK